MTKSHLELLEETEMALKLSQEFLDKGEYDLSAYVLRDIQVVKADSNLSELAWAMYRDGNVSKNDVLALLKEVEKKKSLLGKELVV